MTPWVIIGCGYAGTRLARRLLGEGARVIATRRSVEGVAALVRSAPGIDGRVVDLAAPASLDGVIPAGAIVVDSAPPGDGDGERALVAAAVAAGARRLVYLSSTGVYAAGGGAWVDEDFDTEPLGARGVARLAAERAITAAASVAGLDHVVLRIAGIYGPGRGVHARLARGDYRIVGDGASMVSRIHVDDLASAIALAGTVAPLPGRVYNVADDEPTSSRAHADAVAAMLGVAPPPSVAASEVSDAARAMLGADRKIANARIKAELGLVLRYPSFRQGARQAIAEDRAER